MYARKGLPTSSESECESEKDQRTIGRDQRTNGKHHRKISLSRSLSRSLSLGLNTALCVLEHGAHRNVTPVVINP